MLRLLIPIFSTLLIPSRGLLSFASGLRNTDTQALAPISSLPNLSTLNLSVPSIPPPSDNPSNLKTWPPPPIIYYVIDTCILNITAISMPSPQASSLDVLYSTLSIKKEIDDMGDPYKSFLPIEVFDHGPIKIEFITPLPNHILRSVASSILNSVSELFYFWGIVELKTVQVSTLEGILFSGLSLEIRTDSISPRDLSPSTNTSQPSPNQQSNLTVWPPLPFVRSVLPSTTIKINALSIPAGMPSAELMLETLHRMKDYLDRSFSTPHALLPPNFVSEVAVSVRTGLSVSFFSEQGNWYTWSLARSVLLAVAGMEYIYGAVQLDEVIVSVEGEEGGRTFRLEKFDRHPTAGNIILPRTLLPSSIPSLSLSANRTITSASLQEWPPTPIEVALVPGRFIMTIVKLTPVQDYPTVKADIEEIYKFFEAEYAPGDKVPTSFTVSYGRVEVSFHSTTLVAVLVLQVLHEVGILEGLHGAAVINRAALVIEGHEGEFTLSISRVGAGGLNEDAETTVSRRSLPSNKKESVIFNTLSPSQNITVHDLPANVTAWPPLPMYRRIDRNLFINITAISPTAPPYGDILSSIIDIMQALVAFGKPPETPLPLISTIMDLGRVQASWTSVAPYCINYGIAVAIMDAVLELEQDYGVKQLNHVDIFYGGEVCGRFSLVISDPRSPS